MEAGGTVGILGRNEAVANERAEAINKNGGKALALVADTLGIRSNIATQKDLLIEQIWKNRWPGKTGRGVICLKVSLLLDPKMRYFLAVNLDGIKKVMELNLWGTVLPTQVFGEAIAKTGKGSIVNISSMNSKRAVTKVLGYNMGKAAMDCYNQWFAVELANRYGDAIRMNALAPGFFLTEQNRNLLTKPGRRLHGQRVSRIIPNTPFKRFGHPDELIGALVWLLSDASAFYTTALMICVDGGFAVFSGVLSQYDL